MAKIVRNHQGEVSPFQGEDTDDAVARYLALGGKIHKGRTAIAADYQARGFHQCRMARRG